MVPKKKLPFFVWTKALGKKKYFDKSFREKSEENLTKCGIIC
jgi:hypothetical protein